MRGALPSLCLAALLCIAAVSAQGDSTARTTLDSVPDEPPPLPVVKPTEPPSVLDPCAAGLEERNGVVSLDLDDKQRAGQAIEVVVDGRSFRGTFDGQGHLAAAAPLLHATADVSWKGADGQTCTRRNVIFQAFKTTFTAAVIWNGSYDLAMHVLEPDGKTVDRDWAQPAAGRLSGTYGEVQAFGSPEGGARVLLYTLPIERNPRSGVLYLSVAFASRGNPAQPPFCGDDERAAASYNIVTISQPGRRISRSSSFNPATCGHLWQREGVGYEDWQQYQEILRRDQE